MTIKYILFDNNGVLTTSHAENVDADMARAAGVSVKKMHAAVLKHCVPLDTGRVSDVEFSRRVLRTVGSNLSPKELSRVRLAAYHPKKDIIAFAKQLSKKYPIGLLSNFSRSYPIADKVWKLTPLFDKKRIFLSYQMNMCKPHKNIFREVIRRLGCKPHEIVFIDDAKENIVSARNCGIRAIQFKTLAKLKIELKKYVDASFLHR